MTKLPLLKATKIIKALSRLGFAETRSTGSHVRLVHQDGRKVTIAVHPKPIPKGTLLSILHQAQITLDDLKKYLR